MGAWRAESVHSGSGRAGRLVRSTWIERAALSVTAEQGTAAAGVAPAVEGRTCTERPFRAPGAAVLIFKVS